MHGRCFNRTGEDIAVYGPERPGKKYETSLYRLPDGCTTPDLWDCKGVYVPIDRIADQAFGKDIPGPVAVKYMDFMTFTVTMTGAVYRFPVNQGVFTPKQVGCPSRYPMRVCWPIPSEPASWARTLPDVPGCRRA